MYLLGKRYDRERWLYVDFTGSLMGSLQAKNWCFYEESSYICLKGVFGTLSEN